jgi:LysM repeat protein
VPQATYVVLAGDTCLGIALRYGLSVEELMQINGIGNCTLLREGQVLVIPLTPAPVPATTAAPN